MKNQQPTNKDILEAVDKVGQHVKDLQETTGEILEAVGMFANKTEERFDKIGERFDKVDGKFAMVDERLEKMDEQFDERNESSNIFGARLAKIEINMVTKDYLGSKLNDLKSDLSALIWKEDNKVIKLSETLKARKALSSKDINPILAMEPFPHKL